MNMSKVFSRLFIVVAMVAALLPAMALVGGEECNAEADVEVNTIEFVPADSKYAQDEQYTLTEAVDGFYCYGSYYYGFDNDGNGNDYFELPSFAHTYKFLNYSHSGDKLIINKGTASEKTFVYDGNSSFINQDDDSEWFRYYELQIDSNQSKENPWTHETTDASFAFRYHDAECTVPVTIRANPVKTIRYVPTDGEYAKEGRYTYTEGVDASIRDGEWYYDLDGHTWRIGDRLIINEGYEDEKTYILSEPNSKEIWRYDLVFVKENDDSDRFPISRVSVDSNQSKEHLWTHETTDAVITYRYCEATYEVPVTIKEGPVKTIEFVPADGKYAKNGRYILTEGVDGVRLDGLYRYGFNLDGEDNIYFRCFQIGDKLIINKGTDGEKTYIISSCHSSSYSDVEVYRSYHVFVNQDDDSDSFEDWWVHVGSNQSRDNQWTYKTKNAAFIFDFEGARCTVPVTIKMDTTSVANATITGLKTKVYTGKVIKQTPVVKLAGKTLKLNRDYTVTYKNNKAVGKATVTIKGKGTYRGQISKKFTIKPKGTSLSKVKAIRKGFTVKWKKQARQTTGYQIQYSTSKKFKSGKKIVTIKKNKTVYKKVKKLKGKKTYYVRVRTYKKVGSSTYYSSWSKSKRVKTR